MSTIKRLSIFLFLSLMVLSSFACFNPIPQAKAETWTWKDEFTDQNSRWDWGGNSGTGTKNLITKDGLGVVELKITAASTSAAYSDDNLSPTSTITFASGKTIVLEGRLQWSFNLASPSVGSTGFGFWNGINGKQCWFVGCSPESQAEYIGFRAIVSDIGGTFMLNQPLTVDLTQWHTYRIEISPSGVVFKIDGAVVASTTSLPTGTMYLSTWNDNAYMQNYAMAGYLDASYDQAIWADYIALLDTTAQQEHWSLAISASAGGSVSPSGTVTGASGSATPPITATADSGYVFRYWLYDGTTQYTTSPISLTINDVTSHTLQAVFALTQQPTAIFSNGFEDNFNSWTGVTGSPTTSTAYAHHGIKSVLINTANQGPYKSLGASYADCYARCYVYFTTLPWASAYKINIMSLRNKAAAMPATLSAYSDGTTCHLRLSDNWGAQISGPDAIVINTWYCIELRRQVGVGDQMWLNGVLQGSVAGAWSGNTDRLDIGGTEVQLSSVGYVDDVVVNTAYIGPEPTGPQWTLSITAGVGGSVAPSGTITGAEGASTPNITATANTGYQFSHWLLDGTTQYTQSPISLPINDALTHTLQAVFVQAPTWTLSVIAGTGGSVTPSGASGLPGTSVAVTATPNSGYMFSYWLYDGTTQYTQNPLTLTINDVSSHTLEAVFTAAGALTVTSPDGGQSWVRGTTHTITWTSTGSPGAYVKIELLKGGIVNRIIASSTANDGSYSWTISSTQTVGTDYKIRITSTSYSSIMDSSNSNFAINL